MKIIDDELEAPVTKKRKGEWRVLTSGYELSEKDRGFLGKNKMWVCESFRDEPNVLVVGKFSKKAKIIMGINKGVLIVSPQWLVDCENTQTVLQPREYVLKCKQLNIQKSISIARKERPFQDARLSILPQFRDAFSIRYEKVKEIIESSGARLCDDGLQVVPDNTALQLSQFIQWSTLIDLFLSQKRLNAQSE